MTLCFELQQSHEMDYVLRDEVYTRYLANTYFARKRSDVGCLYQIDTEYIQGKLCSAVQICNLRRKMGVFKTRTVNTRYTNRFLPITPPL